MGKKAIITGASSGIGRALAKVLSANGYEVGLAARRVELLKSLQRELPGPSFIKPIDVTRTDEAMRLLSELIAEMGGLDLIVLNAGYGHSAPEFDWAIENQTISVNVAGYMATGNVAIRHFIAQGHGHIVGVSSVAGVRGMGKAGAYCASKAFVSTHLQAWRQEFHGSGIHITDIRPGFVMTPMTEDHESMFWVADVETAAKQIFTAIKKRKAVAYVTRRWRLIAWLLKALPDWLYRRLGPRHQ